MTPDYHERTRVNACRSLFGAVAGVIAAWSLRGAQWSGFPDVYVGLRLMGVVFGICFLFGIFSVFARERYQHLASKQAKESLISGFRSTFSNRPFSMLMGLTLVFIMGTYTVQLFMVYVNMYYVCGGSLAKATELSGWYTTVNLVAVYVIIPPLTAAAKRWGKERTLMGCLLVGSVGAVAKWFLFDPRWPYAQLAIPFLFAPVDTGFWILVQSMKADAADWDEHGSGIRREGAYAAISSWVQKFSVALTNSIGGLLLVFVGFQQSLGMNQPAGTVTWMRLLFSGCPLVAFAIGLLILKRYPLTQERMAIVRAELETRRAPV
jgi:GPH family glycoside/pentoside/hexuronide:cation symporter